MKKINNGSGLRYLQKEFNEEKRDIKERLQNGSIDKKAAAIWMDAIHFFEARYKVAILIEKERKTTPSQG